MFLCVWGFFGFVLYFIFCIYFFKNINMLLHILNLNKKASVYRSDAI